MARLIDADKIIFREIDEIGGEYEPYLGCSKSQIDSLPSVTPQEPKTGHWIDDMSLGYHVSVCSNCDWKGHGDTCLIYKPKYCPNCGCRMVEPQESEKV